MRIGLGLAALAMVGLGGPAWSQTSPPASAAAQPAPAGAAGDVEVQEFARATLKLHALTQPTPAQMGDAITSSGLTVERYNDIAAQMQKDPAFKTRVDAALVSAETAAQAPAAVPAAAPAPPPPPPPLPTSGPGSVVLSTLDKVCLPMLRQNQPVEKAAPAAGFKLNRNDGSYKEPLGQAPYSIAVLPRGVNKTVCNLEIHYPAGAGSDIANALDIWSQHQQPEMKKVRDDTAQGADGVKRTTQTWEGGGARSAGLVLVRVQEPAGEPAGKGVSTATLLYSEHPG